MSQIPVDFEAVLAGMDEDIDELKARVAALEQLVHDLLAR